MAQAQTGQVVVRINLDLQTTTIFGLDLVNLPHGDLGLDLLCNMAKILAAHLCMVLYYMIATTLLTMETLLLLP